MASETAVEVFRDHPRLIGGLFFMLLLIAEIGQVSAVGSAISGP